MSLKIATVKYLNALPFLHALKELEQSKHIELVEAAPAVCSKLLLEDKVDIALIPVGAIADFEKLYFASEYCIACDGAVRTVKLFSAYSIENIEQIILDPSSRSSNLLVQILCRDLWKREDIIFIDPENQNARLKSGFIKIGDKVFDLEHQYAFEYDLGHEWKSLTGLPFVFAVWVSTKKINNRELQLLNEKFQSSLSRIPEIVKDDPALTKINLEGYFDKNIYYEFDNSKKSGLLKFLELSGMKNNFEM